MNWVFWDYSLLSLQNSLLAVFHSLLDQKNSLFLALGNFVLTHWFY